MVKVLVVIGATGQQGGSVINAVLNDSLLSQEYRVRAITRDARKASAMKLEDAGCEVVTADADDKESLRRAMSGAHTVYSVTTSGSLTGPAIADAALAAGVHFYILSTVPSVLKNSGGTLTAVEGFDVKEVIEFYVRGLAFKSAFFSPSAFMQNFATHSKPRPKGGGSYMCVNLCPPSTMIPLIDIASDTGKFVTAILTDPDKYQSETLFGATRLYSLEEQCQIISKVTGNTVNYCQVSDERYGSFVPEETRAMVVQMRQYIRDYGYYGKDTEAGVTRSAWQARGKLVELEEFLRSQPLDL